MTASLVVDASIAVKWLVPEEGHEAALALLDGRYALRSPSLLRSEVANALWQYVMRSAMTLDQAQTSLADLDVLPITNHLVDSIMPRALGLAVALRHPLYDCVYVALAEQTGADLVTADKRLLSVTQGPQPMRTRVVALDQL